MFERIDVPARPGKENRDRHEKRFIHWRRNEMALHHKLTVNKTEQTKKKGTKWNWVFSTKYSNGLQ